MLPFDSSGFNGHFKCKIILCCIFLCDVTDRFSFFIILPPLGLRPLFFGILGTLSAGSFFLGLRPLFLGGGFGTSGFGSFFFSWHYYSFQILIFLNTFLKELEIVYHKKMDRIYYQISFLFERIGGVVDICIL